MEEVLSVLLRGGQLAERQKVSGGDAEHHIL